MADTPREITEAMNVVNNAIARLKEAHRKVLANESLKVRELVSDVLATWDRTRRLVRQASKSVDHYKENVDIYALLHKEISSWAKRIDEYSVEPLEKIAQALELIEKKLRVLVRHCEADQSKLQKKYEDTLDRIWPILRHIKSITPLIERASDDKEIRPTTDQIKFLCNGLVRSYRNVSNLVG